MPTSHIQLHRSHIMTTPSKTISPPQHENQTKKTKE